MCVCVCVCVFLALFSSCFTLFSKDVMPLLLDTTDKTNSLKSSNLVRKSKQNTEVYQLFC